MQLTNTSLSDQVMIIPKRLDSTDILGQLVSILNNV